MACRVKFCAVNAQSYLTRHSRAQLFLCDVRAELMNAARLRKEIERNTYATDC